MKTCTGRPLSGVPARGRQTLSLLFVSRIVCGIYVLDRPRPYPVKLKHRFALGPNEMLYASRPVAVGPGWHAFRRLFIELVAHADVEGAGDHRDPLGLRMRVWWHTVAVGDFKPKHERTLLGRVSLQDGDHRPF